MSTLDSFPALISALDDMLCARGAPGDNNVAWDRVVIPDDWVDRFNTAEAAADSLLELSVGEVVPDNQLNDYTTNREMSALGALAEEEEIQGLVYANTENGLILKEVLDACTEGELSPLLQAQLDDELEDEDEDEDDELDDELDDDDCAEDEEELDDDDCAEEH